MKIHGLTQQQWRVASLVADGRTDQQIAIELHIEEQTVRFHVWRIRQAWNLNTQGNTRAQIATRATREALKPAA